MKKIVYALVDPRNGQVRYVGASGDPFTRWRQHVAESQPATSGWVSDLRNEGRWPDLRILSEPTEAWGQAEAQLIREAGPSVLNSQHRVATEPASTETEWLQTQIGDLLVKHRLDKGLTQASAAQALGTSQATLSRWESGERTPNPGALYALASVYDLPGGSPSPFLPSMEDYAIAKQTLKGKRAPEKRPRSK